MVLIPPINLVIRGMVYDIAIPTLDDFATRATHMSKSATGKSKLGGLKTTTLPSYSLVATGLVV